MLVLIYPNLVSVTLTKLLHLYEFSFLICKMSKGFSWDGEGDRVRGINRVGSGEMGERRDSTKSVDREKKDSFDIVNPEKEETY